MQETYITTNEIEITFISSTHSFDITLLLLYYAYLLTLTNIVELHSIKITF